MNPGTKDKLEENFDPQVYSIAWVLMLKILLLIVVWLNRGIHF